MKYSKSQLYAIGYNTRKKHETAREKFLEQSGLWNEFTKSKYKTISRFLLFAKNITIYKDDKKYIAYNIVTHTKKEIIL